VKKTIVALISFIILILIMIVIVSVFSKDLEEPDSDKIYIVATLFPQYDFAKQIVGDKGEVKLLVEGGVETHNYEPTAKDMIQILDNADMFLFLGTELEPWTSTLISSFEGDDIKTCNVSEGIELIKIEEFEERFLNSDIVEDEEHGHHHEEIYDEHIWLSPKNASIMLDNILNAICEQDPENAEYYKANAMAYKEKINKIDESFKNVVENAERKEIAVGGEFAYAYLVSEYDINFVSVYKNCGDGEDPSIARVKSVIDYINKNDMHVVYFEELSEGTVAKMIAEETNTEALVLYTVHNGDTKTDTYVSLMEKNIENLSKGLK